MSVKNFVSYGDAETIFTEFASEIKSNRKKINDVSYEYYIRNGQKNLAPMNQPSSSMWGVSFTNNGDGTYTVNGTNSRSDSAYAFPMIVNPGYFKPGRYTLSGIPSGTANVFLTFRYNTGSGNVNVARISGETPTITFDLTSAQVAAATSSFNFLLSVSGNAVIDNVIISPMLVYEEVGEIDSSFEKYHKTNKELEVSKADQAEVNTINNLLGAKNLLPSGAKRTVLNGITFGIGADGHIGVTGTATADARIAWYFTRKLPAGKYTIGKVVYNAATTGGIGNFAIMNRTGGTIANVKEISFSGGETTDFTLDNDVIFTEAAIYVKSGTTVNLRIYPYVYEENTKDQNYTPYVPSNSEVISHAANSFLGAKNLLPNENTPTTVTAGNVIYTKQADGTITTNGGITASSDSNYNFWAIANDVLLPPGRYILSGCPDGGAEGTYCLYIHFRNSDNTEWAECHINGGGDTPFTVPDGRKQFITIRIKKNTVIPAGGFTFKPMIRLAEDSDAIYRPYAMTNREITNELVHDSYVSSGLTCTGCEIIAGGYTKIGNLVVVCMRIKATATGNDKLISGFPAYTKKTNSNNSLAILAPKAGAAISDPASVHLYYGGVMHIDNVTENGHYFINMV